MPFLATALLGNRLRSVHMIPSLDISNSRLSPGLASGLFLRSASGGHFSFSPIPRLPLPNIALLQYLDPLPLGVYEGKRPLIDVEDLEAHYPRDQETNRTTLRIDGCEVFALVRHVILQAACPSVSVGLLNS